jgi:hypothetical protein
VANGRMRTRKLVLTAAVSVAVLGGGAAAALSFGDDASVAGARTRPHIIHPPSIAGTAQVAQRLSVRRGRWSPNPSAYRYAWQRCSPAGARCRPIAGATRPSYRCTPADLGKRLRVRVVALDRAGASRPALSRASAIVTPAPASGRGGVTHLEYVFNDGPVSVYSIDEGFRLIETFTLPGTNRGVRGVTVSPQTHVMYVFYGGDGGGNGDGSVLAYDLLAKRVLWSVNLGSGIDSGAVSSDGKLLYVPDGELSSDGTWNILSTADGSVVGRITTPGEGPHDGVLSADGHVLLLGERNYSRLPVYDTQTGKVQAEIGPLVGGVRPNTINGSDTIGFTTATGFDGFQVESLTGARVLYTESFGGCSGPFSTCSHGISLSPDSSTLYVIDSVHKAVQVWDVHGVGEGVAPAHIATVPVDGLQGEESGCAYDCSRDGWLQATLDGRYVIAGDSGDVISTASNAVVARIANALNTRELIEVDWSGGVPVATSGRQGIGLP